MVNTKLLSQLRVLVVGLGSIGVRHLTNLRRLGCGHVGAFRSLKRPLHKPVDLSGVALYDDFDKALRQGYDAVVVCNPTSLHLEYAQRAAETGCHLYVEKPLSDTLENIDELLQTVRKNKLVVMVGCQFRFHPNLITVKRWLGQKLIGRLLSVQVDTGEYLPGWHPWEDYRASYAARQDLGGGVILTLIHEIDYLYWLLGPLRPLDTLGGISGALEVDVEDHMTSMLLSHEHVPVMLHMDYLQKPPCRQMKIIGNHGVIEWDYYQGIARLMLDGELKETSELPPNWERNDLFLAIMSDFLESVCQGRVPRVPLEDGIETLRIALELKAQLARQSDDAGIEGPAGARGSVS